MTAHVNAGSSSQSCDLQTAFRALNDSIYSTDLHSYVYVNISEDGLALELITVPGLAFRSLLIQVPTTETFFGFGNMSANAELAPTFTDFATFAIKAVEVLGIEQDVMEIVYSPESKYVTIRFPFVHSFYMSDGSMEPFAFGSISGSASIGAFLAMDVRFGIDLNPPIASVATYCRWDDQATGILPQVGLNLTIDGESHLLHLTNMDLANPPLLASAIEASLHADLPSNIISQLEITSSSSSSLRLRSVSIRTLHPSTIRSILIFRTTTIPMLTSLVVIRQLPPKHQLML
jgi:hypothetical protein